MAAPGPDTGTAPDEGGQGTAESTGSIFDPYLQDIPDGWDNPPQGSPREIVSNYLKDAEKNVNTRLSDAAALQKQFGDYKDIDLSGVPPEQLQNVIAFVTEVGSSPEAYAEWVRNEATEMGLLQAAEQEAAPDDEADLEQYIQSRIDQALNPVTQKLSQFEQSNQAQQQAEAERSLTQHIESSFSKIEAENEITLSEDQREAILALGDQRKEDDFVEWGFAKLRALEGGAQTGFVKGKQAQPTPSLRTGGQPAPAKGKSFADVRGQAMEMLNQAL